jgi:hypothetical protein
VLVTLISAKGSPGVTTAAAALAAVGAEQRGAGGQGQAVDLVELDPSGGDIEPLTGITGESGLLRAASDLRPETVVEQAVEAPRGVRSLMAPTSGPEALATVTAAVDGWGVVLSALGGVIVADAGRWERVHPSSTRLVGSDVVAMVCRPHPKDVEHVRHISADVRSLVWPAPVVVLAVGDEPYKVDEIAGALAMAPAGTLAWDPRGASALWAEGIGSQRFRRWSSCWLARSARTVLAELVRIGATSRMAAG